jgi:hypothetical protein
MAASDASGSSGWSALGTWGAAMGSVSGPTATLVDPGRATGLGATFKFTFTDTNGVGDIAVANVLIRDALDARKACYIAFLPGGASAGTAILVDDAGDAGGPFAGVIPVPGSGNASNGLCTVSGAGTVSASGNTLTVMLPITFNAAFTGNMIVYMAARSNTANSGWQALGTAGVR